MSQEIEKLKKRLTTMAGFGSITKGDILDLITTIAAKDAEIADWKEKEFRACSKHHDYHVDLDEKEALIESLQQKVIVRDKLITAQQGHIDTVNAHLEFYQDRPKTSMQKMSESIKSLSIQEGEK